MDAPKMGNKELEYRDVAKKKMGWEKTVLILFSRPKIQGDEGESPLVFIVQSFSFWPDLHSVTTRWRIVPPPFRWTCAPKGEQCKANCALRANWSGRILLRWIAPKRIDSFSLFLIATTCAMETCFSERDYFDQNHFCSKSCLWLILYLDLLECTWSFEQDAPS